MRLIPDQIRVRDCLTITADQIPIRTLPEQVTREIGHIHLRLLQEVEVLLLGLQAPPEVQVQ